MQRPVIGVRSFQWPVFDPRGLMGGWTSITAAGGHLPHISLFNNATDGSYLYVLDFQGSTSGNASLTFELGYGTFGQNIDPNSTAKLVTNEPVGWGQFGTFQTTACVTPHIGGSGNAQVNSPAFNNRYPLAILSPGFSFIIEGSNAGTSLVGGLWWYVGDTP
jgi:hypothetical protein